MRYFVFTTNYTALIASNLHFGIRDIQYTKIDCSSYNFDFRLMAPLILIIGWPSIFIDMVLAA